MAFAPHLEAKKAFEEEAAGEFSFDVRRLRNEVMEGDMTAMVIRAHLFLEHVLIQTLADAFRVKDAFNLRRINFPQKLDLCIALGLLPAAWRRSVMIINQMRNDVAHQLDHSFPDSVRLELWDEFPPPLRELVAEQAGVPLEEGRDKAKFLHLFKVLIVWLDISRQNEKKRRIHFKYAMLNAKHVLDGINKLVPPETEYADVSLGVATPKDEQTGDDGDDSDDGVDGDGYFLRPDFDPEQIKSRSDDTDDA
jgi:hypothetical protein